MNQEEQSRQCIGLCIGQSDFIDQAMVMNRLCGPTSNVKSRRCGGAQLCVVIEGDLSAIQIEVGASVGVGACNMVQFAVHPAVCSIGTGRVFRCVREMTGAFFIRP